VNAKTRREREIQRSMQRLSAQDPKERREAALYLGEAAAVDAVDALIDTYETDEDDRVRKAAAYALGQFKAIDRALSKGKQKRVEDLLKQVENRGKLGARAAVGPAIQVIVILTLLLALLVAANVFAPLLRARLDDAMEVVEARTAPVRDRATLISDVQAYFVRLRDDTETLRSGFTAVLGGGTLPCPAQFSGQRSYLIAPQNAAEHQDIAAAAAQLNRLRHQLEANQVVYDRACSGESPIAAEDIGTLLIPVREISDGLVALQPALTDLGLADTAALPPTPTPDPANPQTHVAALRGIVNQMVVPGGAVTQLVQNWTEAKTSGGSAGCAAERPTIPDNYALPSANAGNWVNLAQAVTQVNTGLQTIRDAWDQYARACSSGTLTAQADAGLTAAQTAQGFFDNASGFFAQVEAGTP
jgi:hypothetical protein